MTFAFCLSAFMQLLPADYAVVTVNTIANDRLLRGDFDGEGFCAAGRERFVASFARHAAGRLHRDAADPMLGAPPSGRPRRLPQRAE